MPKIAISEETIGNELLRFLGQRFEISKVRLVMAKPQIAANVAKLPPELRSDAACRLWATMAAVLPRDQMEKAVAEFEEMGAHEDELPSMMRGFVRSFIDDGSQLFSLFYGGAHASC